MSAADLLDFPPRLLKRALLKSRSSRSNRPSSRMACPFRAISRRLSLVEDAVRETGAVPATIAVIEGRFRVGLTGDEIERLGKLRWRGEGVAARSVGGRRTQGSAGTTVAATMYIAGLAGIEIFATGGIGGVHRGAEETSTSPPTSSSFRAPASPSLRRREIDPRHRQDARVPRDAGSGDRRLPLRRVPRLLRPLVRLQARASL